MSGAAKVPIESLIAQRLIAIRRQLGKASDEQFQLQVERVVRGALFTAMMESQFVTFPENEGAPDLLQVRLEEV